MNSWKAFSASCWLWKNFACRKLLRCLKSGSQLVRDQVNMADEAKLCSPTRSPFAVSAVWQVAGVTTQKNSACSADQRPLRALQVLKRLFNLLSRLLRGDGSSGLRKLQRIRAATGHGPVIVTFFGARLALGSGLEHLLSPTSELVIAFSLNATIQSRNGLLLRKIREYDTLKRQFF